MGNKQTP
jgi:serine/threonine protein kinase